MNFKNLEYKCLTYRSLTDYKILPNSNVIVMVDGRAFSKLIKKRFSRPFDDDFVNMMNETAKYVCQNVEGCKIAYVQSDEISFLITDYDKPETDAFFGYRLCKLQSIIASLATAEFNRQFICYNMFHNKSVVTKNIEDEIKKLKLAEFDCKAWPVPTSNDAFAWFLYRQIDCIRNSKQQTAQTWLSHKELLNLDTDQQIAKLRETKGIDWEDFDNGVKYGRFVVQQVVHMSKTINGKEIEFDRNVWTATPGFELTGEGGKGRFYDMVPVLKMER